MRRQMKVDITAGLIGGGIGFICFLIIDKLLTWVSIHLQTLWRAIIFYLYHS